MWGVKDLSDARKKSGNVLSQQNVVPAPRMKNVAPVPRPRGQLDQTEYVSMAVRGSRARQST